MDGDPSADKYNRWKASNGVLEMHSLRSMGNRPVVRSADQLKRVLDEETPDNPLKQWQDEHIKKRIRQHSHFISPTCAEHVRAETEADLLAFILYELAQAEKRGHGDPMCEHEERNTLRHLLALAKKQSVQLAELLKQTKPKVGRWLTIIWPLEPIQKKEISMDPINLGKIPLGQRMPVQIVPDEPVDVKPDGNFAAVDILSGDSTSQVANQADPNPARRSTPTSSFIYFNGDGAVGPKSATVSVDGHVGDGDVEVTQEYDWEVTSPDATAFKSTPGTLEPIPTLPKP